MLSLKLVFLLVMHINHAVRISQAECELFNISNTRVSTMNHALESPSPRPTFLESIVLDDLPQVQKDNEDLIKTCLVGKMLGGSVDLRVIIARTKADWKFCNLDVNYLEMGNGWVLIRFANTGDLFLVWPEKHLHV